MGGETEVQRSAEDEVEVLSGQRQSETETKVNNSAAAKRK